MLRKTWMLAVVVVAFPSGAAAQKAELFAPGVISTGDYELNAAFSPSGDTLLFTKSSWGHWLMTVFLATRRGNSWVYEIAPFSGTYSDVDAIFSPDGREIYWVSDRPTAATDTTRDYNVWRVTRESTGWSAPLLLPEPIASPAHEYYPGVTRDGTVYFSSQRPGNTGRFDIYRSRRTGGGYAAPELLPTTVNTPGNEIDLYVDPDERFMVFVSYGRPDERGGGDLYVSFRQGDRWSEATNLGEAVNTPAREYTPFVSPDGQYLYFTSERSFRLGGGAPARMNNLKEWEQRMRAPGNGMGDIYRIPLRAVPAFARLGLHPSAPRSTAMLRHFP